MFSIIKSRYKFAFLILFQLFLFRNYLFPFLAKSIVVSGVSCTCPDAEIIAGKKKENSRFSAAELLDKSDKLIDEFQYDLAEKFCQRALDLEPENMRAIETQGFLLLQAGSIDEARAVSLLVVLVFYKLVD